MGSIQIKKVKLAHLPEIYAIHEIVFPNPAKPRYYENLRLPKDAPFYVALNEEDEVVGYLATRVVKSLPNAVSYGYGVPHKDTWVPPHLVIATFAALVDGDDSEPQKKTIKEDLIDALMVQVRIGGIAYIQADIRESDELSINLFTEYGFERKEEGKYRDGENKLRFTYDFDMDTKSKEFKLERATFSHLGRIRMLHNEYLQAQKDYGYFARIMRRKGSVLLVVIDEYGRVVGYLAARRQHKITDDENTPYTTLNFVSMAVDKMARGHGLGRVLVERLIGEAKGSDVEIISGHVREANTHARKLYKELGFRSSIIGEYKDTEEKKYRIRKRIRLPSIKPYIKPTLKNGTLVAFGYLIRAMKDGFSKP
jgi:ribosomal protein S18 acetylase RimI-like enzyme